MEVEKLKMRFVGGSEAHIMDTPFTFRFFGQLAEIPADVAKAAQLGRIPLIPVEDFERIGFTPDELKRYQRFESHDAATEAFIQKRSQAWGVYLDTIDALRKEN